MPRKPLIHSNEHHYHVTARSNNKEHFHLPIDRIWHIMNYHLRLLQITFDLRISAFVLMQNHFHLVILTPKESIDRIMYFFMKRVTLQIQKESGRINKIFGGRYKGCLITDEGYLHNVYKYVYRNPVKAGIVKRVETYPYSSLFKGILEIEILFYPTRNSPGELQWLNDEFEVRKATAIQKSLRKTEFRINRKELARLTMK